MRRARSDTSAESAARFLALRAERAAAKVARRRAIEERRRLAASRRRLAAKLDEERERAEIRAVRELIDRYVAAGIVKP